jgi:hypothetical protein
VRRTAVGSRLTFSMSVRGSIRAGRRRVGTARSCCGSR